MLLLLLAPLAFAAPPHEDIDAGDWTDIAKTQHAETGRIQVSRQPWAGVNCYRAAAQVPDVSIDALLTTVTSISNAPEWSTAGVAEGMVLTRTATHLEYYQVLDVPDWTLASDRYWFLAGDIVHKSSGGVSFRWDRLRAGAHASARARVEAEHPGAVEPPVNVGAWTFTPAGEEVAVTYIICSDTGGNVPKMLQNAATRQTLPDTIGDLVREARRIGS